MVEDIRGHLKEQADAIRVAAAGWLPKIELAGNAADEADEARASSQKKAMVGRLTELIDSPYTDPDIKGRLRSVLAVLQDAKGSAQINAVIGNALSAASTAENMVQVAGAAQQQEIKKLWTDFANCEKEIQDEFEKFYANGKISYDQMLYLRTERTRLDALPQNSPARIKDETTFAEYQKELGIAVREQAHKDGDHETEHGADKLVHQAGEQKKRLEQIHNLHVVVKDEKQQEIARTEKKSLRFSEDDRQQIAATTSKENQGMHVTDTTLHDIQVPAGGKDRTAGRITAKT